MNYSLIMRWSEEDEAFLVWCPEIPGLKTHGETRGEAAEMFEEALSLWLECLNDDAEEISAPLLYSLYEYNKTLAAVEPKKIPLSDPNETEDAKAQERENERRREEGLAPFYRSPSS